MTKTHSVCSLALACLVAFAPTAATAAPDFPIDATLKEMAAEVERAADAAEAEGEALAEMEPVERPRYPLDLTTAEIRGLAEDEDGDADGDSPQLSRFVAAMRRLDLDMPISQNAAAFAGEFGLEAAELEQAMRLWATGQVFWAWYDFESDPEETAVLRRDLVDFLNRNRRAPLAFEVVAEVFDRLGDCREEEFADLVAGSPDPAGDAWRIIAISPCSNYFTYYLELAPDRAVPALIKIAEWGSLGDRYETILYGWLTSEQGLSHIRPSDRPAVAAQLYGRYTRRLFRAGLYDRALGLLDGLPEEMQARIYAYSTTDWRDDIVVPDTPPETIAMVDGLPVEIDRERRFGPLLPNMAAARLLAGRRAEAAQLVEAAPGLAAERAAFACHWGGASPREPADCPGEPESPSAWLVLDQLLNRPDEDPYPFAESRLGSFSPGQSDGAAGEILCLLFDEPQYDDICRSSRRMMLATIEEGPQDWDGNPEAAWAAIEALGLPGWAENRDALTVDLEASASRLRGLAGERPERERETVLPDPPDYALHPLPPAYRSEPEDAPAIPDSFASLPDGHYPVRWWREGDRAAVISLSQAFDPSGEVSGGGYWLHLSRDGGHSWSEMLYTGLAEYFPYVVKPTSELPLFERETLQLEVVIAELDTASITYPPVGLRTRRQESDLFLEIPLARLREDSDADGLTDIAERHLLLDRRAGGETPLVLGGEPAADCGEAPRELRARMRIMEHLFGLQLAPIIEPVDRPADAPLMGGWRRTGPTDEPPIFLKGRAEDFRCLRPDRPVIVYDEADLAELRRHTPDFHAIELPQIVFNRARTRGYVQWTAGWAGGAFRLRLVDGDWQIKTLSQWVT